MPDTETATGAGHKLRRAAFAGHEEDNRNPAGCIVVEEEAVAAAVVAEDREVHILLQEEAGNHHPVHTPSESSRADHKVRNPGTGWGQSSWGRTEVVVAGTTSPGPAGCGTAAGTEAHTDPDRSQHLLPDDCTSSPAEGRLPAASEEDVFPTETRAHSDPWPGCAVVRAVASGDRAWHSPDAG